MTMPNPQRPTAGQMEQRMDDPLCARCGCYRSAHGEDERCEPVGWSFRPTADLGDDGELVERLRLLAKSHKFDAVPVVTEAADRLILYREALTEARAIVVAGAGTCEEFSGPSEETRLLDILDTALTQARQEGDK